jgi:hypothetical protein
MTAQGEKRASGRTTAEVTAHAHVAEHDTEPATVRPPEASTKKFDFTGFSRIRTEWRQKDLDALARVNHQVEDALVARFRSLYKTRESIFWQVRIARAKDGEPRLDRHGLVMWRKHPENHPDAGEYIEDWSLMTDGFRRQMLDRIVNYLFDWQMAAEELRAQALYARASYEEMFAVGFESLPPITATRPTVDDREQRAKLESAEERLFALFVTQLSRQADALVRSAERLEQRLKDLLPQR